jgi:HK97 family phage major capsid protein
MDTLSNPEAEALDTVLEDMEAGTPPAPSGYETKSHHEAISRAHAAFRDANDRLLAQAGKGAPDAITRAEVETLNAELDRLTHEGAPEHKALGGRRPAADNAKAAIVAIGKEVLAIGQKVNAMQRGASARPAAPTVSAARLAEMKARTEAARRQLEVKRDRPPGLGRPSGAPGRSARPAAERAYKAAVIHWMRTGDEVYRGMPIKSLQAAAYGFRKDMHTELNPDGGYLVKPERRGGSPLEAAMAELTPMRRLATVHTLTEGDVWEIPVNKKGTAAGWIGERESRPTTTTPDIGLTSIPAMELYAMPAVSQRLLNHVDFDVESWLTAEVAEAMSLQEGPAYITGTGVKQPRGLLTFDFVTDHSTWEHGKFRLVETGVSGAFPAIAPTGSPPTHPGHCLIDVQYSLKTQYRAGASWLMNRSTAGAVRKLTDERGNYLWQPGITAGQPPTLLASAIEEEPNMPDIGADTVAIGYGAWDRTYAIVEKGGVRVLRDPYSQKPFILFYTTKLVGGGVQNFDAAIFLRFGA